MASRIFIDVMPSPLLCAGNPTRWDAFELIGSDTVRVYSIFASGGPGRSQHPWVDVENSIKSVPANGGEIKYFSAHRSVPYLTIEPTLESKPYWISADADQDAELEIYPADTILYEIENKNDARVYYEEFIRNIRRYTRQVWVGKSSTYTDARSSCVIELDDQRKAIHASIKIGPLRLGFQSLRLCTEDILREAWKNALITQEELAMDIVHSAHHAMLSSDKDQFYMLAGIAIEKLKYRLWNELKEKKSCSLTQYKAAINDTKKPHRFFSEVLEGVIGRSLLNEHPEANVVIKNIWIARGLVAHGKKVPQHLASAENEKDIMKLYDVARFVDDIKLIKYSNFVL